MIDLHTVPTPNGHKISIMLEEVGLPYKVIEYDIMKGDQLKPEYLKINPNNKMPAIVDNDPIGGGAPYSVFETGAILLYLAEKTGRFLPADPRKKFAAIKWLMFQVSGLGPYHGQAHHFVRYARVEQAYAKERYMNEARRLLRVMDTVLSQTEYLAGDEYTVADIASWPWIRCAHLIDLHTRDYPSLHRWFTTVGERNGVKRGMDVINGWVYQLQPNQFLKLDEETWSNSFGANQYRDRRC